MGTFQINEAEQVVAADRRPHSWFRNKVRPGRWLLNFVVSRTQGGTRQSMRNEIAWQLEHSVETDASPSFAWRYLTDVRNWDDPPAHFQLDGPFTSGVWGATVFPGREPCAGASVTFGPAGLSSLRCRSTERCCRLSGRLTPCRTGEHELRNALSCRATMLPHMRLKYATVSD